MSKTTIYTWTTITITYLIFINIFYTKTEVLRWVVVIAGPVYKMCFLQHCWCHYTNVTHTSRYQFNQYLKVIAATCTPVNENINLTICITLRKHNNIHSINNILCSMRKRGAKITHHYTKHTAVFYGHHGKPALASTARKRISLEQIFTACIHLTKATSSLRLRRKH